MDAAKERLAVGYSRSAVSYDALAGQSYLTGLRRLLPRVRIPPGAAILDVGSGTGLNLFEAARWFFPTRMLCGIDISPGMVQTAQAKAALLGIPAQFTLGDAERLPYPDGTFDLVICNSVLQRIGSVRDCRAEVVLQRLQAGFQKQSLGRQHTPPRTKSHARDLPWGR